ncbi:MAG TPA: CcdB family protein [Steroidobacteraceae bacterium]|nr:CcdB family protein [Steroidobacteraceae bacterium]
MSQFAVYRNENPGSSGEFPFLVDVQAELLEDLATRVVIPLAKAGELTGFPTQYLTPLIVFEGRSYALLTPQLAGISRDELGAPTGSLADQERVISTAIEFLLRGF